MDFRLVRINTLKFIEENWKKLLWLYLPVIICILVYISPSSFQEALVQNLNNINLWTWFSYILVHESFMHIFMNMLIYIFAITGAFVLIPRKDRKYFLLILYSLIFLIPLITLIIILLFRNVGLFPIELINSRGFSGVSSGALGMLGFAISRRIYLSFNTKKSKIHLLNACYYIFLPSLAVMVINLSLVLTIIVGLIWAGMVASWILPGIIKARKGKVKVQRTNFLDVKPLIIPMTILLFGVLLLIPKNVVNGTSKINTPAHLFGFVIGFWALYFAYIIFHKE